MTEAEPLEAEGTEAVMEERARAGWAGWGVEATAAGAAERAGWVAAGLAAVMEEGLAENRAHTALESRQRRPPRCSL